MITINVQTFVGNNEIYTKALSKNARLISYRVTDVRMCRKKISLIYIILVSSIQICYKSVIFFLSLI